MRAACGKYTGIFIFPAAFVFQFSLPLLVLEIIFVRARARGLSPFAAFNIPAQTPFKPLRGFRFRSHYKIHSPPFRICFYFFFHLTREQLSEFEYIYLSEQRMHLACEHLFLYISLAFMCINALVCGAVAAERE